MGTMPLSFARLAIASVTLAGGFVVVGEPYAIAVSPVTVTFTTTGEHAFTVPAGVSTLHVVAIGGKGGGGFSPGGPGARVEGNVTVTPGHTLYVEVAGNGAPATTTPNTVAPGGWYSDSVRNSGEGGAYTDPQWAAAHGFPPLSGGGGGGASGLKTCSLSWSGCFFDMPSILLAAGGGGGAGADSKGGAGGTPNGQNAVASPNGSPGGEGGTTSTWGYGGGPAVGGFINGDSWLGGRGQTGGVYGGGGGGGGYYGGGSGAGGLVPNFPLSGGGGGGSSFGPAGTQYTLSTDAPSVTISYTPPTPPPTTTPPKFTGGKTPTAHRGKTYRYRFAATGNPTPTIALTAGKLPPGLMLAADGTVSGTPTRTGKYRFTLSATNGVSPAATTKVRIRVVR